MDQGLVTNPKDLERMQHELVSLERRISTPRGRRARGDGAARGGPEAAGLADRPARGGRRAAGRLATARDEKLPPRSTRRSPRIDRERAPAVDGLPDDLLALYDQLRDAEGRRRGGRAARPRVRRLPAHASTTPSSPDPAAPSDEVMRCEECQRILVRTARVRAVSRADHRSVVIEADGGVARQPRPRGVRRGAQGRRHRRGDRRGRHARSGSPPTTSPSTPG